MHDKFFIQQPIRPIAQTIQKGKERLKNDQPNKNFEEIFHNQLKTEEELKFSKHAQDRLSMRNIKLNQEAITQLNAAVEKARDKGAKESLILMNDIAFVVSIQNKTVITAVNGPNIRENVFTNIDSAVII
ncbi:MAG: TIGR02530 family flagellar biosynthesis protein [Peptococcales bacterium]|jgi:flagellar operon protein